MFSSISVSFWLDDEATLRRQVLAVETERNDEAFSGSSPHAMPDAFWSGSIPC